MNTKGFSLIEVMMSLGITVFMALGIGTVMLSYSKSMKSMKAKQDTVEITSVIQMALDSGKNCKYALRPALANPCANAPATGAGHVEFNAAWRAAAGQSLWLSEVREPFAAAAGDVIVACDPTSAESQAIGVFSNKIDVVNLNTSEVVEKITGYAGTTPIVTKMWKHYIRLDVYPQLVTPAAGTTPGGDNFSRRSVYGIVILDQTTGEIYECHSRDSVQSYFAEICEINFDGHYDETTWPRCMINNFGVGVRNPSTPLGGSSSPLVVKTNGSGVAMTIDGDGSINWPGTNSISNSGPNFTLKANNSFNLETGGGGVKQIQTTSTSIDLCPDGNTCTAVNLCKNSSGPCYANANDGLMVRRHFIIQPFIGLGLPVAEFYAGGHWWQGGLTFHNGTALDLMGGNMGVQPGTRFINSGGLGASLMFDSTVNVGGALTASTVTSTSDARLKDKIKPLDNSLDKILKLEPVSYRLKGRDEKQIGFIAQQVEQIFPEVVREDDKGFKSLAYGNLVAPLTQAIQEVVKTFKELFSSVEKEIKDLKLSLKGFKDRLEKVAQDLIQVKNERESLKKKSQELEARVKKLESKKQ